MPLSWNEIRSRAIAFSREWTTRQLPAKGAERAEAQTFWNEFFEVFGKKRRHVAAFEALVKNLEGNYSRIDLLWPGQMLAEHKSPGAVVVRRPYLLFYFIFAFFENSGEFSEALVCETF